MSNSPLVSIIINNYNYERYLEQAIQSALSQDYPHYEVIVVDDGSTDNSRTLIEYYSGRVKSVFKPNGGQGSAFNAGFEVAQGDVILFLDADDFYLPHTVSEIMRHWRPGTAEVMWRLANTDSEGKPIGSFQPSQMCHSGDHRRFLLRYGQYPLPPTSGLAFSREVLNQILPLDPTDWRINADTPLFVSAPFFGEVVTIPKVLGNYRLHGNNLHATSRPILRQLLNVLRSDYLACRTIEHLAQRMGLQTHYHDMLIGGPYRILTRLVGTLFNVIDLPEPHYTALQLCQYGARASLMYPWFKPKVRMRFAITFLRISVAPLHKAQFLALRLRHRNLSEEAFETFCQEVELYHQTKMNAETKR